MLPVMMDAHDDFDAALYAAITGYYRLANSAMRSALELVTIGTWAKLCGKQSEFNKWEKGEIELSLGIACDGLIGATPALRTKLTTLVNDSLFDQKTNTTDGGWVRRAFRDISDFSHSRPGFTDFSMRKSTGPIYVPSAFNYSMWMQAEIVGLLFVLLLIANPNTRFDQFVLELFADTSENQIAGDPSCISKSFIPNPRCTRGLTPTPFLSSLTWGSLHAVLRIAPYKRRLRQRSSLDGRTRDAKEHRVQAARGQVWLVK